MRTNTTTTTTSGPVGLRPGHDFTATRALPGLLLIGLAVTAVPLGVAAAALMMLASAGWLGLVAALLTAAGLGWLIAEHRVAMRIGATAPITPTDQMRKHDTVR